MMHRKSIDVLHKGGHGKHTLTEARERGWRAPQFLKKAWGRKAVNPSRSPDANK
jgi:hypothetical protein